MGFDGAVDINISIVLDVINLLGIEEKEETLFGVLKVWRHIYSLQKNEAEEQKSKTKPWVKKDKGK